MLYCQYCGRTLPNTSAVCECRRYAALVEELGVDRVTDMMRGGVDGGGPAFPCEGGPASGLHPNPGMSLRDWFAGQVLAGVTANNLHEDATNAKLAAVAYEMADAMLAERAKRGK